MRLYYAGFTALMAAAVIAPAQTINDFFDDSALQDLRLTIADSDWQSLHDRYTEKKTYYRIQFEWRGMTVPDAALRTRGTGSLNPIKPGMEVDFDKYVPGQTFVGLQTLILRNYIEDPSGMHERLTMAVFAKMGLPSLRNMHARLYVNGKRPRCMR